MVKGMAKGMDFSIDAWMEEYQRAVKERFGGRVWFIGLQGSFGRGEATEGSDIDAVLILDTVSAADLQAYGDLLDGLPQRDRVCGFVSGQEELLAWEPSDLFQFYHDTVPLFGSLDELSGRISREDVVQAIHLGACNIYHMTVHNLVHEKSVEILKDLCKSAVFVLQAIAFWQTGIYARKKTELAKLLGHPGFGQGDPRMDAGGRGHRRGWERGRSRDRGKEGGRGRGRKMERLVGAAA